MFKCIVLLLLLTRILVLSKRFNINWNELRPNDYLPPLFSPLLNNNYGDSDNNRIVGGHIAEPHSYPYQVGLALTMSSGSKSWCGGSIISNRFVLTAAHCLEKAKSATILLGAHDIKANAETGRITVNVTRANFNIHEGWNMNDVRNDIALIKLPHPIPVTETIRPIELPSLSLGLKTFEGSMATISGWGDYGDKGISRYLRYTKTRVISNRRCRSYFGNLIRDSVMCLDGSRGNGTCYGDSGGPLVVEDNGRLILAGITSFGSRNGCQNKWPTAFTRTTHYTSWLAQHTEV